MSNRRWRFIDELNRQDPNAFRYSRMGGDVGPALIFRKANRHNRMVAADWECALRQDAAALTVAIGTERGHRDLRARGTEGLSRRSHVLPRGAQPDDVRRDRVRHRAALGTDDLPFGARPTAPSAPRSATLASRSRRTPTCAASTISGTASISKIPRALRRCWSTGSAIDFVVPRRLTATHE